MAYHVRQMRWEDIDQVKEIDLLCFPNMLPLPNYKTELINPMAHYLVAYDDSQQLESDRFEHYNPLLLGFAGVWLMAGEAHVINIAVRPEYHRQGIGELLLIYLLGQIVELKAGLVTLEVRLSNMVAQQLYAKYGFTQRGIRHAYYNDNREDAIIMTLDGITSAAFRESLDEIKQAYAQKWGISLSKAAG